jgi:chromatin assembly factor 1 subunit A
VIYVTDKVGSPKCAAPHSSQQCLPPNEPPVKTRVPSPGSALKLEVSEQQIGAQGSSGSAPHLDPSKKIEVPAVKQDLV